MRYLSVFIVCFALSACVSTGTKVDPAKVVQFEKGKTTYNEVIQQLGKPNQSTIDSNGIRIIVYTYVQSQMSAASFIPYVGAFVGGSESESTTTMLRFTKELVLIDYTTSEGALDTGTGIISGGKQ